MPRQESKEKQWDAFTSETHGCVHVKKRKEKLQENHRDVECGKQRAFTRAVPAPYLVRYLSAM